MTKGQYQTSKSAEPVSTRCIDYETKLASTSTLRTISPVSQSQRITKPLRASLVHCHCISNIISNDQVTTPTFAIVDGTADGVTH